MTKNTVCYLACALLTGLLLYRGENADAYIAAMFIIAAMDEIK